MKRPIYSVNLAPKQVNRLKRRVRLVMALSEADMVALVPDKTGFRFVGCPNCDAGAQEGQLQWSIQDPHHVQCRYCEMVFPNEAFPENQVLEVVNPVGVKVAYPFWKDETGYRYHFRAKAWREARVYFGGLAEDLGQLYQATGEADYARRAVLILDAFARYYPGFLVSLDRAHQQKGFVLEPPYPNFGGKWGRWRADEMPVHPAMAYDAIYESGELERLSEELGVDVKACIENDFLRGAIRQDGFQEVTYGNASPRIYLGYAVIGRVLGDSELVHEAVRRSSGLFERRFFVDGFWNEGSLGYHRMTMAGMQVVFDALKGYSDPEGYVHPGDGERFDDLDMERDISIVGRAKRLLDDCRYPDGRWIPMHDAWARLDSRRVDPNRKPLDRSHSTLLAGVGHAWLGRGTGENQAQAHLHFSGAYGHAHADNLNLMLFAREQELLPDVGYTHTRYRGWTRSTLCHNTVVIDEKEQQVNDSKGPTDGQLLAFEPTYDTVQWMEARGERGYPGLAETYRRLVMMVAMGKDDVYLVDLFTVLGGTQHDWVIHGSADRDVAADLNVPLQKFGENLLPGVKVRLPEHERDSGDAEGRNINYAFFQHVSQGDGSNGLQVRFQDEGHIGVRTHVIGQTDGAVFLGDAPSVRRADEDEPLLDPIRMPMFLIRRKGSSPLESQFLAVHEPFSENASIDRIEKVAVKQGVYLKVYHGDFVDHILLQANSEGLEIGDLSFQGEAGFVREQGGNLKAMGLWAGNQLGWQGSTLAGEGAFEGQVKGVRRIQDGDPHDALIVDGLPGGRSLAGATVVVTFGDEMTLGFRVVEQDGHALVLETDPGFRVTGTGMEHCFFPLRTIEGPVRFKLRTSVFMQFNGTDSDMTSIGRANFQVD